MSPSSMAFKIASLPITSLAALIAASLSVIEASWLMSSIVDFSIPSRVANNSLWALASAAFLASSSFLASSAASLSAAASVAWSWLES